MKQTPREFLAPRGCVIDMLLQILMEIVDLAGAIWQPLPWILAGVEFSRTENRLESFRFWQLRIEDRAADL